VRNQIDRLVENRKLRTVFEKIVSQQNAPDEVRPNLSHNTLTALPSDMRKAFGLPASCGESPGLCPNEGAALNT
jgi:hypothetical protein